MNTRVTPPLIVLFITFIVLVAACSGSDTAAQPTPAQASGPPPAAQATPAQADGPPPAAQATPAQADAPPPAAQLTPAQAGAPPPASEAAAPPAGMEYAVTNPTSGARLRVLVYLPQDGGEPFPALVLVPGGSGASADFTRPGRAALPIFTSYGFAVVLFDPDGRGESEGVEDYDGYTQQDGLAAVIEFAASLPEIDASRLGIVSYSFGVTMASGALARHPDLPARFLIDWEGPANRDDTGGCDESGLGHLGEAAACDDEAFWAEHEAASFAAQLQVPYLRLQSEKDHVQPDYAHAILMVNNATAVEYGGNGRSPWTRLNELPPNQTYDRNAPPPMMSESEEKRREALIAGYALELLALP